MRQEQLECRFEHFIPEVLEEGLLYISMEYSAVLHKCFCGCGSTVSTPLSPSGWKLTYDGKTVTLDPSIGCYQLPCKSHYNIKNNRIIWYES